MNGRLNSFQRTMLQWNEWHPYNAVHVVQVPGPCDEARLHAALRACFFDRGLTQLAIDRSSASFQYEPGAEPIHLESRSVSGDFLEPLRAEMERQLNTPFPSGPRMNPLRFFVLHGGSFFLLGLAYFHPVADAEAMARLLKDFTLVYQGAAGGGSLSPLELYPDSRAHLLGRHFGVLLRKLCSLPAQHRVLRRSHRPRYRDPAEFTNGFRLFGTAPGSVERLRSAAKGWGATFNDLMLGALMRALAPLAGGRMNHPRRRHLTLGCIVNTRGDVGLGDRFAFGLFLGSFNLSHPVPDGVGLGELTRAIARQTLALKANRLYLGTPVDLAMGRCALRFFSADRQRTFYQKNHPLMGGVTNMNLNPLWTEPPSAPPADYYRGVSTGPATPLVLSVTSVADRINLGLSFRSTVFSSAEIDQVKARLLEQFGSLGEEA